MTARQLLQSLRESSGRRLADTVDQVIIGDPEKEVRSVLTTWICSLNAVQAAITGGFDAIVTHEPTFYFHKDELENQEALGSGSMLKQAAQIKRALINEAGLVVIRVHDAWDFRPYWGVADSWARHLGLGEPVAQDAYGYQKRYDIEPIRLDGLARRVAARTAVLGEPTVQVIGRGDAVVSKVCLGAGYCCTVQTARELGCDVNILCDDGTVFWMDIQCAVDLGHSIIRVNHGTSEEAGIAMIAQYINNQYPGLRAVHFPLRPYFHMIGNE